jgi:hypothetical protein
VGSVAGWWLEDHAPNYGRVAVIQSGAFLGAAAGLLAVPALGFGLKPSTKTANGNTTANIRTDRVGWGILAGMNAGLVTGLGLAYLPDQRAYGPSWQRVMLIDLAAVAGGFAGAIVQACVSGRKNGFCGSAEDSAEFWPNMARYALAGAGVGLAAGLLLTWRYDKHHEDLAQGRPARGVPLPSALPVQTTDGRWALVPGLVSQGQF